MITKFHLIFNTPIQKKNRDYVREEKIVIVVVFYIKSEFKNILSTNLGLRRLIIVTRHPIIEFHLQ